MSASCPVCLSDVESDAILETEGCPTCGTVFEDAEVARR